ncbi:MAG: tRNA (adenosine(37)-N6)-dimethylallyltransferase MiaA [Rhodospirillales bacterium]|jgi:tRNA dimethylallyltransferase
MRAKKLNPILIVAGPTASGKSNFALAAAHKFDGVIINCDAMQVYRELRIISARPSEEDEAKAPHKLYGLIPASQSCSVGVWRELAVLEIEACWNAGKLPIITGGTGLYIKSLMEGLTEIPDVSPEIRAEATTRLGEVGATAFHRELSKFDPVSAKRLNPADSQRVIRAFEIYLGTNRCLSDWHANGPTTQPLKALYQMVIFEPPRAELYAKCESRFDLMIANGALEEVDALRGLHLCPTLPAMKALGVQELISYLNGDLPLEVAFLAAQQATRRYAKRQLTWFRNQITQNNRIYAQYSESLLEEIFSNISI